ncbi:Lipase-like protein [Emericellopsis cladophorae]|uniref:Patatin-like phospholipase domain-containing protein n=1 Tax=Emericellopsis cladophorae TaxID=2686198 RepID=A0A9Q0BF95_9HYPO|nr:Lipase-like protein [Emericellopsis cladophorae]KAI6782661.1 Lipase-like protein [Emericellopsis cladophorae]
MADLLVPASSSPAVHFKTLLHSSTPRSGGTQPKSLRSSKSTPILRDGYQGAILRTVEGVNNLLLSWKDGLSPKEREERRMREQRRQILCERMKNADTLEHWNAAARELDELEGNDLWKLADATPSESYNPGLIADRLTQLEDARTGSDIHRMMHLVRTALCRDLGGMDDVDLYRHSYVGTKRLIERYVESALATIDTIVTQSTSDKSLELRGLLEGMLFARQSFGRSALLLSGGGTFGMAHVGVLKSLFEAKLLPRIISGASAGSIVCAVTCTRTDEELPALMREFPYGDLAVFEDQDNRDGILGHLRRLLTEGSWSDIKHLTRVMRELTGDITFQEAYNRTRRILNICVSTTSIYELPRLLNYITAPNVMIWSAVAASCSVPLMFNASPLLVKDPATGKHSPWNPSPQRWIDGSVDNDLPMTRLAEMFNVNHFIVSQVNPHVVPFLSKNDYLSPESRQHSKASARDDMDWMYTLTTLAKEEALHRLQFLAELGIWPNLVTKFWGILGQRYSGDITILPEMSLQDLPNLLTNPTSDFMLRLCHAGERATWPKLSRIRDRCSIEMALDQAVHRLRARVVFSEDGQDLQPQHQSFGNLLRRHSGNKANTRSRRQSGGSLLSAANRRALLEDGAHAEEDSTREPYADPHHPTLRRASKSHVQVNQYKRPGTAERTKTFTTLVDSPKDSIKGTAGASTGTSPRPETNVAFLTSTEDVDTSEPGPSSDMDIGEPSTDETDMEHWPSVDPYGHSTMKC